MAAMNRAPRPANYYKYRLTRDEYRVSFYKDKEWHLLGCLPTEKEAFAFRKKMKKQYFGHMIFIKHVMLPLDTKWDSIDLLRMALADEPGWREKAQELLA